VEKLVIARQGKSKILFCGISFFLSLTLQKRGYLGDIHTGLSSTISRSVGNESGKPKAANTPFSVSPAITPRL
jgi:hypothetical protein